MAPTRRRRHNSGRRRIPTCSRSSELWAGRLASAALLAVAAFVLWRELGRLDPADIWVEMAAWGPLRIAAAVGLTLVSYALLAAMEWLGLKWSGASVSFRTVLLGSFCANAFAHTIGFAVLIGGAIRARLYARSGASLLSVAQTSIFCALSFGCGMAILAGAALLLEPLPPVLGLQLHPLLGAALGLVLTSGTRRLHRRLRPIPRTCPPCGPRRVAALARDCGRSGYRGSRRQRGHRDDRLAAAG